ncbi:choice-of-anchor P family protein [Plantactinospora sonchi]|uniref:Choice-of-anchor P family protein n=1 Tax=Plantactinospora sonchi TaxID=1544735 RepID=A0ABU7RQX1_9ACTN
MKRRLLGGTGLTVAALVVATTGPAAAHPSNDNLPGGTSISVSITTPANGSVRPPGPVPVQGTASIGTGVPVANTALIYVLDVSGSTDDPTVTGCGGDQNGDGRANRILDCEIAAARELNNQAVATGTVGDVGVAVFAENAATADVTPGGGDDLITGPTSDLDGAGGRDVDQVLTSANSSVSGDGGLTRFAARSVGNLTNFAAGVQNATAVAAASDEPRKIVAFVSDGVATAGGNVGGPLASVPANVDIFTFAVGQGSTCDNTGGGRGSLQQIADATGGECIPVPDVADLPDIVPGVIASELTTLTMSVNGGTPVPITDVTPALPENGPASVNYSTSTAALAAGSHQICVTANGTDGGGAGDVTDCHTVVVNAPPTVDAGGPYAGQEGTAVSLAGEVVDPDGPSLGTAWSYAPASGVDAGATCSFGDAAALATTVTCTDDGVYELTLTADDSVNPPVEATVTLTLSNVAPAVTVSAPADGALFAVGAPVTFTAPFTDVGTNDSHTCTVDFDDGTPVAPGTVNEAPGAGTCATTHAFTAVGPHDVLVRVTDDDGGSATDVVRVVVYLPGGAFAIQASGLLTVPRTPDVTCPPDEAQTQALLNTPVGSVSALNASCTVDPETGRTEASASIDQASLLAGLITVTNIESSCVADADGVTRSSSVGTINGIPIGLGSGSINVGLVQVFYNESRTNAQGQLVRNAIRVVKPPTLIIPGQEIILASCRLG